MKKVILITSFVLCLTNCWAQDNTFGVRAGLNISNFKGDVENNSAKIGQQLGIFGEFKISEKFTLQPELVYSWQGANFEDGSDNLGYLNLPILFKYYVTENLSLEAGPQVGILLSAFSTFNDGIVDQTVDTKESFKSNDFSFNIGVGYNFNDFQAGIRYTTGLSNIYNVTDSTIDLKNTNILIFAGYKFF